MFEINSRKRAYSSLPLLLIHIPKVNLIHEKLTQNLTHVHYQFILFDFSFSVINNIHHELVFGEFNETTVNCYNLFVKFRTYVRNITSILILEHNIVKYIFLYTKVRNIISSNHSTQLYY